MLGALALAGVAGVAYHKGPKFTRPQGVQTQAHPAAPVKPIQKDTFHDIVGATEVSTPTAPALKVVAHGKTINFVHRGTFHGAPIYASSNYDREHVAFLCKTTKGTWGLSRFASSINSDDYSFSYESINAADTPVGLEYNLGLFPVQRFQVSLA